MDDVEQLQSDLWHFDIHISANAAQRMIEAGWKKRFEPLINRNVITQTQNPIPDMRQFGLNRQSQYER